MKKQRLDAGVHFDFEVLGIVTTFRDYKLAWVINNSLGIELKKEEDLLLQFVDYELEISHFTYSTENTKVRLLRNRSLGEESMESLYLIPEMPSVDFFLTISVPSDLVDSKTATTELRSTRGIEYVGTIDLESVKSRENFLE